jgi:hypothetical protein
VYFGAGITTVGIRPALLAALAPTAQNSLGRKLSMKKRLAVLVLACGLGALPRARAQATHAASLAEQKMCYEQGQKFAEKFGATNAAIILTHYQKWANACYVEIHDAGRGDGEWLFGLFDAFEGVEYGMCYSSYEKGESKVLPATCWITLPNDETFCRSTNGPFSANTGLKTHNRQFDTCAEEVAHAGT